MGKAVQAVDVRGATVGGRPVGAAAAAMLEGAAEAIGAEGAVAAPRLYQQRGSRQRQPDVARREARGLVLDLLGGGDAPGGPRIARGSSAATTPAPTPRKRKGAPAGRDGGPPQQVVCTVPPQLTAAPDGTTVRRLVDRRELAEAVAGTLLDLLAALRAQLITWSEPDWLRQQDAAAASMLLGVTADRALRIIEAAERGAQRAREVQAAPLATWSRETGPTYRPPATNQAEVSPAAATAAGG